MQRFLFMHWLLGTGMRRGGTCLIVCFLLVLPLFAGPVGSHDASALTVNIKEHTDKQYLEKGAFGPQ